MLCDIKVNILEDYKYTKAALIWIGAEHVGLQWFWVGLSVGEQSVLLIPSGDHKLETRHCFRALNQN